MIYFVKKRAFDYSKKLHAHPNLISAGKTIFLPEYQRAIIMSLLLTSW
jgi:hypothetical protein